MAKYTKLNFKTVDEWLAARRPYIGGSEVSAIIGINPWMSKYELYMSKKNPESAKEENLAMRLGHKLENTVAELLHEEAGYQIIKNTSGNLIYISKDFPFAEASPDRIGYLPGAVKNESNKCIIEIKTTQKSIDEESIPEHWICQVQWYMGITGIHKAVIAWLTQGRDFGYAPIEFSEEFFTFLTEEACQFKKDLENNVVPDAITARDINARYPRHETGKVNLVSEDVALACNEYKELKAQIKALEERKDACEEIIKVAFADAESIAYGGLTLATYKSSKDTEKFDAKAFRAENPELASKYTSVAPGGRRLNVK